MLTIEGRVMARPKKTETKNNGANLGFEARLWLAADAMRGSMDAAEYKHVALFQEVKQNGRN
jgi:type I restriction enzyme M protein